jgi:hypothetical protein
MTISRSSIPQQIEGKLRGARKEKKKVQVKKKPNRKNFKTFTV